MSPLGPCSVIVSILYFESGESVPEFRGAVGCCGEITGIGCGTEVVELGVDPTDIGTVAPSSTQLTTQSVVRGVCDPVPYPPEGGDIAFDRARVIGSYVDHNLTDAEVKAGEVDLCGGSRQARATSIAAWRASAGWRASTAATSTTIAPLIWASSILGTSPA